MRHLLTYSVALFVVACGGSVDPTTPTASDDLGPTVIAAPDVAPGQVDAGDGGGCWRCADRAWRNVCVVPAVRADDAVSCLMCGEHCVSDPPDAGGAD